jgi:predicted RNA-binding Zn-ribbon protein involved in translation (DUF1610 family)
MTVSCMYCGQQWPHDPALDVPCPHCGAAVGKRCQRPSGHSGNFVPIHASRDRLAMAQGLLHKCTKAPAPASPPVKAAKRPPRKRSGTAKQLAMW